ncbi:MAG: sigma-70 family RNA polymerase sigma factor [Myxococcota bacterium]
MRIATKQRPRRDDEDALAALVEAAARGDRRAARSLFDAVVPIFARMGRGILGPKDPELDDFVQDASLRFFRGLHTFRGESRVRWFAFRVAKHTATDWIRGRHTLKRSRTREELPDDARGDDDPGQALRRRRIGQLLIDVLPEHQLQAFLLRSVMGFTIEEISEETAVPINTVRSRLRRAKRTLRERLLRDEELRALLEVSHDEP